MQFFKSIISSLLILSVPAAATPSIPPPPKAPLFLPEEMSFPTYEDLVAYIERIENDDLESICSPQDFEKLNMFMAQLAKAGLLSEEGEAAEALHADIEDLLGPEETSYAFAYSIDGHVITPKIFPNRSYQEIQCKSWIKKTCHKIKTFVKKHKTEILIGAAIVVTVVVVVVTVGTASGAGAAVVGAAVASADELEPSSEGTVQDVIEDRISDLKEMLSEVLPEDLTPQHVPDSFGDTIRKIVAVAAHETLDGVATIVSILPEGLEEMADLSSKMGHEMDITPRENFERITNLGHECIDKVFSIDIAYKYSAEGKAAISERDMQLGIIPISPNARGAIPITGHLSPTQVNSIKGWAVGQDIRNLTADGNVPKWTTVRQRYWKNQFEWAKSNPGHYNEEQLTRMKEGLAPQKFNKDTGKMESMELHHNPAQRDGGLFDFIEVWPDEHAAIDPSRKLRK